MKGKDYWRLEWSLHGYKGAASCLSLSHYPPARGPLEQPLISITWHSRAIELIGLCEPCNKGFCAFLRVLTSSSQSCDYLYLLRVIPKWCPWTLQRTKEKGTKLLLWLIPYLFPLIPLLSALFNSPCLWRWGLLPQTTRWLIYGLSPFLLFSLVTMLHICIISTKVCSMLGCRIL